VLATPLMQIALEDVPAALARFKSHKGGIAAAESAARPARDGPNEVAHEEPMPAGAMVLLRTRGRGFPHACPGFRA